MSEFEDSRPDPEAILARIDEKKTDGHGMLRIFFGYAAGVGKTFSMLQAARNLAAEGKDVVVGYVEPHGRVATEVLLEGLPQIPPKTESYRGVSLAEFDLDEAIRRRPEIVLLDELAHTNAPWARHPQRYLDAVELLENGIDVFTTLNVQHLESVNDIVAGITGIVVQETLPDLVFDKAVIDLVDLPPDDLIERFREGKVYLPDRAMRALDRFFRRENLVALREIALRRVAEQVNQDVESSRRASAAGSIWRTQERLLVCVSPSGTSGKLIRRSRRMAAAFGAQWIACYVDTTGSFRRAGDRERLAEHLALAESLGAEVQTLQGEDTVDVLIDYALKRNVSRIVIGKNADSGVRRLFRQGVAERLIRKSGDIDVYVVRGDREEGGREDAARRTERSLSLRSFAIVIGALAGATLVAEAFRKFGFTEPNIIMVYVLAVFGVATIAEWAAGLIASIGSVLAFNFFFTEPYYTFAAYNTEYIVTFIVMLVVALVTNGFVLRLRRQMELLRGRQNRTETLYRLSRSLSEAGGAAAVLVTAARELSEIFLANVRVARSEREFAAADEQAVARWVMDHGKPAGSGTDTLPGTQGIYYPLKGAGSTFGVVALPLSDSGDKRHPTLRGLTPDQKQLLEAVAALIAFSIERDELSDRAHQVLIEAEHERTQNALLRSVSHDLRTPLATIVGAAGALKNGADGEIAITLIENIEQEAEWLRTVVESLLQLTQLDEPRPNLTYSRETVDDIVSSAVSHLSNRGINGRLHITLPTEVVTIDADPTLIQQAILNLIDNAVKYSDSGSPIELSVRVDEHDIRFAVADRGRGILEEERAHLFDLFYRGKNVGALRGTGLGLAICKAVVVAHRGQIFIDNREGGGCVAGFSLPFRQPAGKTLP